MSDDTTTDDSTDTLTLRATGPAVIEREQSEGALDVVVTEDARLSATIDVDAGWIESHGGVYKQGAHLKASDITELIAERLSDDGVEYYVEDADAWTLTLDGRVDDWCNVAVRLAQNRISVGPNSRVATTACHILDGLAEYTPDGTQRPRLAMLDLIGQYDVGDYTREGILDELHDDDRDAAVEEVAADV
jgi:hypothetical protein